MTPLQLSSASGVPFYRQVTDQVGDLIRSGKLPPGTLLPSVRDLAAELSVSLITIRRAYADLEATGLVQRRQGQGTFVSEDVGESARRQALADAQAALQRAVDRARKLGLDDGEVRDVVDDILRRAP